MKSLIRTLVAAAAFVMPAVASAAFSFGVAGNGWSFAIGSGSGFSCGSSTICGIASTFLYLINHVLVPLLFAVAFIVFLYGVAETYIFSRGEAGEVERGHKLILWGLVGFAIMISLWGLVNVVVNTFGLGGFGAPRPPQSCIPGYTC